MENNTKILFNELKNDVNKEKVKALFSLHFKIKKINHLINKVKNGK